MASGRFGYDLDIDVRAFAVLAKSAVAGSMPARIRVGATAVAAGEEREAEREAEGEFRATGSAEFHPLPDAEFEFDPEGLVLAALAVWRAPTIAPMDAAWRLEGEELEAMARRVGVTLSPYARAMDELHGAREGSALRLCDAVFRARNALMPPEPAPRGRMCEVRKRTVISAVSLLGDAAGRFTARFAVIPAMIREETVNRPQAGVEAQVARKVGGTAATAEGEDAVRMACVATSLHGLDELIIRGPSIASVHGVAQNLAEGKTHHATRRPPTQHPMVAHLLRYVLRKGGVDPDALPQDKTWTFSIMEDGSLEQGVKETGAKALRWFTQNVIEPNIDPGSRHVSIDRHGDGEEEESPVHADADISRLTAIGMFDLDAFVGVLPPCIPRANESKTDVKRDMQKLAKHSTLVATVREGLHIWVFGNPLSPSPGSWINRPWKHDGPEHAEGRPNCRRVPLIHLPAGRTEPTDVFLRTLVLTTRNIDSGEEIIMDRPGAETLEFYLPQQQHGTSE